MDETLYTVTAGNTYFWQKLAVRAADAEAAAVAFRAYLSTPAQRESEEYEQEQGRLLVGDDEPTDRNLYVYKFEDEDVEGEDDGPIMTVGGRYIGEIGETVKMVDSGGNG